MNLPLRPACLVAAVTVLTACAPALDWRDVRPAATALQLQFPCKPIAQERRVALAGPPVLLSLSVCNAGGQTWGLAHADVGDPARVGPALQQLQASAVANVAGPAASAAASSPAAPAPAASSPAAVGSQRFQVPGMTPGADSQRARLAGQLPDGAPVQMQLAVFAHGTRVFQATVLGQTVPDAGADTFFDSMVIRP